MSAASNSAGSATVSPTDQPVSMSSGVAATTAPEMVKTREEGPLCSNCIEVRLTALLDQGRPVWELINDEWIMNHLVPRGSRTDGASVPFPISIFIPVVNSKTFPGCVLHDRLLQVYRSEVIHGQRVTRSRKEIDAIFHRALLVNGVNRVLAFVMWTGVRLNAYVHGEK